jgi:hydroxymethylglutaryl-CoA lyase/(R)-citramalyl-CoA lyase
VTATRVLLCDVCPRDGLQSDAVLLAPAVRAELVDRLATAGLPRVEAASFVHPGRVPQMAGAEEVMAAIERRADVAYAGLVLNERGLERALAAGVDVVHVSYPVTDSFARANQNATAAEAAATAARIVERTHEQGLPCSVTLSVCFGCPFEGEVDPGVVQDHVERVAASGADELMLADTIGVGVPAQVRRLLPPALAAMQGRPVGLHLHNTRNTGYANAAAALESGARLFDASLGGLGGCPFAPGATGNIATEDLVYLLERTGVQTGVDLDRLIHEARWLAELLGRELPGLVHRAGPFRPSAAAQPQA